MKELIKKLKDASDYIKGRTQSISVALKFEELEDLLQALTSVKSAEEHKQPLQEFIDSRPYYGSCDSEYKEGIEDGAKWMHDFTNNSEQNGNNTIVLKRQDIVDAYVQGSIRENPLSTEREVNTMIANANIYWNINFSGIKDLKI